MNDLYKKVNLSDNIKKEFENFISKIEIFFYKEVPEIKQSNVFIISKEHGSFMVETRNSAMSVEPLSYTWEDLKNLGIIDEQFFKNYQLEFSFAKGFTQVEIPHRHIFPKSTKHTLTFFGKNSDNSVVNFYDTKSEHSENEYEINDPTDLILLSSVNTNSNEVYSLNSYVWHNWIPKSFKAEYFVFQLKANSVKVRDNIIEKLENAIL